MPERIGERVTVRKKYRAELGFKHGNIKPGSIMLHEVFVVPEGTQHLMIVSHHKLRSARKQQER